MASARKRSLHEVDGIGETERLRHRLRNMWQFANLCQWIYLFGKAVKIDESLDVDEIEAECLKPNSPILVDIGLALLKFVSSQRGLTFDTFEEHVRKQYLDKAPDKNPFGTDNVPYKFNDFDVVTKIRVLQQLTQWTMIHPERIREKMEEHRDVDQASWRIEPYGWDSDDRTYFVLDDNRVYRMTESPLPPVPKKQPKKGTKAYRAGQRVSKRRRVSAAAEDTDAADAEEDASQADNLEPDDDGLGGMKWECVAVTLGEVLDFLQTIQKSRDDNEKILRKQLQDHLVPILEKQEEARERKQRQHDREVLNALKMVNAKRSNRLASKAETQKAEEMRREEENKRLAELAAIRQKEKEERKREKERDLRLMSREQRIKDRETKRIQRLEELAQLSEGSQSGRLSERHQQAEIERKKRELKELEEEEEDWYFDCACGAYGQVDDGTHSIACEKCNAWQHSKCVGIPEEEADQDDFHFVCDSCRRREEEAKSRPKPTKIKLKVNRLSSSHQEQLQTDAEAATPEAAATHDPKFILDIPVTQSSPLPAGTSRPPSSNENMKPASATAQTVTNGPAHGGPSPALASYQVTPTPVAAPTTMSGPAPSKKDPAIQETSAAKHSIPTHERVNGAASSSTLGHPPLLPVPGRQDHPQASPERPPRSQDNASVAAKANLSSPLQLANGHHVLQTPVALHPTITPSPFSGNANLDIARTSPLVPTEGGLSPTKTSPPLAQSHQFGAKINGVNPILPPVTTLSPTLGQQILTPPVKHAVQGTDDRRVEQQAQGRL